MSTLPEEAVKAAAQCYLDRTVSINETASSLAHAMLTAALPFLSGQAAGVSADARQALDRFSFAAQQWGWQADQGSNDAIINDAKAEFDASYAALERILSALEPSAARELALEEAARWHESEAEGYEAEIGGTDVTGLLLAKEHRISAIAIRALSSPDHADADTLETYYARQIEWSKNTFGPALRTKGIIDHIKKELKEIEAEPHDLSEWIDVVILAMDGFWRHGGTADDLMPRLLAKQQKNMARTWPDWRTMSEDQAIEHDRSLDTDHADAGKVEGDGWLPIESAPKDGTPFLVFVPDDDFSSGTGIDVIWYDEEQWLFGSNTPFIPANDPTHWRPLPSAPASEGGSNV